MAGEPAPGPVLAYSLLGLIPFVAPPFVVLAQPQFAYLLRYAQEAAWREDSRRVANGEQVGKVAALALTNKPSVDFCGYWQRRKAA